jgi:hypothetical protein
MAADPTVDAGPAVGLTLGPASVDLTDPMDNPGRRH